MKYYLGIDGGGTKTAGVLINSDGEILSEIFRNGSAIIAEPSASSLNVLKDVADTLCKNTGISISDIDYCGLGLNGIDFDDEIEMQFQIISKYLKIPENKFQLVNDGIVALWGASSSRKSVILQHGTGFTSAFRNDYGNESLYDHLGVCSCYDLRDESLSYVSRIIAAGTKDNYFTNTVLNLLEVSCKDFPILLFKNQLDSQKQLKVLQAVYDLYVDNNEDADIIIGKAIDDYINLISGMLKRIETENATAILGGGVLKSAPKKFRNNFKTKLQTIHPNINIQSAKLSPAIGAAIMAAYYGNENIEMLYEKIIKTN